MQDIRHKSWCAYHKDLGVKYVGSEEEYDHLLKSGWVDSPAKLYVIEPLVVNTTKGSKSEAKEVV